MLRALAALLRVAGAVVLVALSLVLHLGGANGRHALRDLLTSVLPGLVPGQRVVIDSTLVRGAVLRITEAVYSGDTAGASWDAELTLKRPPTTLLNRSAPGVTAQNE